MPILSSVQYLSAKTTTRPKEKLFATTFCVRCGYTVGAQDWTVGEILLPTGHGSGGDFFGQSRATGHTQFLRSSNLKSGASRRTRVRLGSRHFKAVWQCSCRSRHFRQACALCQAIHQSGLGTVISLTVISAVTRSAIGNSKFVENLSIDQDSESSQRQRQQLCDSKLAL